MKSLNKLFFLLLVSVLIFSGCKDEDEPTPIAEETSFEILSDYMVAEGLDLPDVLNSWIVAPPAEGDLETFLEGYTVIDIRSEEAYNDGHIEGAINSSLGTILDDVAASTDPILVVCYTGQSAGHVVVALRLSGYPDAKVLKWGMSGWGEDTSGPWANNIADNAVGHSNWVTTATADIQEFENPSFTSTSTDGATILAERVQYMIDNGFQGVVSTDVLDNPGNYFINNYWAQSDVDKYGHIDGAYRIQPMSLESGEFKNLDPDATVVTYCWTGQTSSMITAYLTVMGFDAKSLKFGSNNMIYSELEGHKYKMPETNLPVVQ